MSALLYIFTLLVTSALVEFLLLRRWYPRRSLPFCIILGGAFGGVVWSIYSWMLYWTMASPYTKHATDHPQTLGVAGGIAIYVVTTWIFCGVALIPASLTAIIYRRCRGKL